MTNIRAATIKYKWGIRRTNQTEATRLYNRGDGPIRSAQQVVTIEIEDTGNLTTHPTILIYFYNNWAQWADRLHSHGKITLEGKGIVLTADDDGDSEAAQQCLVVAEPHLMLQNGLIQENNQDLHISIQYQGVLRAKKRTGSDQIKLLDAETVNQDDLLEKLRVTSTASVSRSEKYTYTSLKELMCGKCSLYGAVVNATFPKRSQQGYGDWMITIAIIDPTCPTKAEALSINIFCKEVVGLPRILYYGDLIRFHRLQVKTFQNKLQGTSGRFTRFIVLRHDATQDTKFQIYSPTERFTFDEQDQKLAMDMYRWSIQQLGTWDATLCTGCQYPVNTIANIYERKLPCITIDLIVELLHIEQKENLVMFTCRDASCCNTFQFKIEECWEILQQIGFTLELLRPHTYVKLRSLVIDGSESEPKGFFAETTAMLIMPSYAAEVLAMKKVPVPSSTSPPEHVPFLIQIPPKVKTAIPISTLSDVLRDEKLPNQYHCVVKVQDIYPTNWNEVCVQIKGVWKYQFVLRIQDDTASMDLIVTDPGLFPDLPPTDYTHIPSLQRKLHSRLEYLKTSGPFHCCLFSYTIPSAIEKENSSFSCTRRYQICQTSCTPIP